MAKHRKPPPDLPWMRVDPNSTETGQAPPATASIGLGASVQLASESVPSSPSEADQSLITDLAALLSLAAPAISVAATLNGAQEVAQAAVKALLELSGIRQLLRVEPPNLTQVPVRLQNRQNLIRRATYLLNAARRLTTALKAGQLSQGLRQEGAYLRAHMEASAKRELAAQAVADEVTRQNQQSGGQSGASDSGSTMLGWYSVRDENTTADCRAAHGKNFNPARIPLIGYPGTVHPHCRCKPGPAHPGARYLAGSEPPKLVEVAMSRAVSGRKQAERAIELVKSSAYPDLERVPGKQNWVDKAGGLPSYIERIAKHLHYEKGMDISRAIATAVSTVKRWAAGGDDVSAQTRAKATKAVAEWEAKKARSHAD